MEIVQPANNDEPEVTSINGLTGAITLAGSSSITITPSGNTLTISTTPISGFQTPWLQDINAASYDLNNLGNLRLTGHESSILPPISPSVAFLYSPLLPPTNIVINKTFTPTGVFSYNSQDYPSGTSPDIPVTYYAWTDQFDFSTWSSASTTFNFPNPAPIPAVKEVTNTTTVADVAGSLQNLYWVLYDTSNTSYYIWYNVDGGGSDPAGGDIGIEVDITSGSSANTVASATRTAITTSGYFTVSGATNHVITTNLVGGACTDGDPVSSGFNVTVTTQGADIDYTVTFNLTASCDAVTGATGYSIVLGVDEPVIPFTMIYADIGTSETLNYLGDSDLGVAQYPDVRPLTDGVTRTYHLYSSWEHHATVVYSATSSTVNATDNNSGHQINSELISWTRANSEYNTLVQRPSDSEFAFSNTTSLEIVGANFFSTSISNNTYFSNDLLVNSSTVEIDGANETIKFWGDFQTEKFHGVSATSSGADSFAWGPGSIASGINATVFSTAGVSAGDYGFVMGIQSRNYGIYGIAGGDNAYNYANGGVVFGGSSVIEADATRGVIIGPNNHMYGVPSENGGIIVGNGNADHGIANATLGTANNQNGNNSVNVGTLLNNGGDGTVMIGFNFTCNDSGVIAFGNTDELGRFQSGYFGLRTSPTCQLDIFAPDAANNGDKAILLTGFNGQTFAVKSYYDTNFFLSAGAAGNTLYIGDPEDTGENLGFTANANNQTLISGRADTNSYFNVQGGNVGIGTDSPFDKLVVAGGIHSTTNAVADQDSETFIDFIGGYEAGRWITVSDGTKYPTFTFECHWNAAESQPQVIPFAIQNNADNLPSVGFNTLAPTALVSINDRGLSTTLASFDIFDNDGGEYAMQVWSSGGRFVSFGGDSSSGESGGHIVLNYDNPTIDVYDIGSATKNARITGDGSNDSYFAAVGGKVGFGTTSPSQLVDVNGNIRLRSAIYDQTNSAGSSGDIATNNGSGLAWKSPVTANITSIVSNVALTNQGADITTTNLATVAGRYRVSYNLQDTTADVTAGVVTLTISYTDGAGATTTTTTQALTGVGRSSGSVYVQLASGNLTYATSHTGIFGTAKYALYITTERLA